MVVAWEGDAVGERDGLCDETASLVGSELGISVICVILVGLFVGAIVV